MQCWLPHARRSLTPRQRQIAQLRADGLNLAQIAEQLGVSLASVSQASASIGRRLRPLSERERVLEIWPERANALAAEKPPAGEGA